jgi:hypothetical protein
LGNSLWLKLFGPDGVITVAEFREAILNARLGQGAADDSVLARVRAIISAYINDPERTEAGATDQSPAYRLFGPDAGFQLSLRLPVIPGDHDLVSTAGPGIVPVATLGAAVPGPTGAAGEAGDRIISLQVGLDPQSADNPWLITCDGWEAPGTRNGYLGGWLDSYVRFFEPQQWGLPGFEFHNVAQGDLEYWTSMTGPADEHIDTMALSGDFSSGFILTRTQAAITDLLLCDNHDYSLATNDDFVAAGARLTVHGERLAPGGHVMFDGSGETDGSFSFLGSDGNDFFFGGAGDDLVRGGGGGDTLTGGGGHDVFTYGSAGESTGAGFDTLADFDPAQDRIDLPGTVTGFDTAVQAGSLSASSFDGDLGRALPNLGAGHAVVFAPDAGDFAGKIFLVIDGNGVAGYQAGEDYVFALPATALADLSAHPNFLI